MKYKIFIDSNQVFSEKGPLGQPFNLNISTLRKFIDEHNVSNVDICIPEIVIRERIQSRLEDIEKHISLANEPRKALNDLGHDLAEIHPLDNYKEILEKNAEEYIKENRVIKIAAPAISKEELIDRAINKMRPFNSGNVGFKDTLIYLSIVEDALSEDAADRYLFCTNDSKGFDESVINEFKEKTGRYLYVLPHVEKVREKLDELIPLNLHLEKKNIEIRNLILSNIGEIMHAINKTLSDNKKRKPYSGYGWGGSLEYVTRYELATYGQSSNKRSEDVVGYNYDMLTVDTFKENSSGNYKVSAMVNTLIQYKDESSDSSGYDEDSLYRPYQTVVVNNWGSFDYSRPESKAFFIEVECDLINSKINLISVSSGFVGA